MFVHDVLPMSTGRSVPFAVSVKAILSFSPEL